MTALEGLKGLIVIDEIQRMPDLFPVLRVLADRLPLPARFLILGSASPNLLSQASESLAGRIETISMSGFGLPELGRSVHESHWLRGGFPPSYLADSEKDSLAWRKNFIQTFLEQDLPMGNHGTLLTCFVSDHACPLQRSTLERLEPAGSWHKRTNSPKISGYPDRPIQGAPAPTLARQPEETADQVTQNLLPGHRPFASITWHPVKEGSLQSPEVRRFLGRLRDRRGPQNCQS